MNLTEAKPHIPLKVTAIDECDTDNQISRRLLELGFIPGSVIEIRNRAPITQDPIAVLVRGMVVALRRYEAGLVRVETASGGQV